MDAPFDMLGIVSPGRETWRFKVRVLRLWKVYSFMKPDQVNSLEMVLIDEKGAKIHASVRRQLLYLFISKINEGQVYKMSHFTVAPQSGFYRTTSHPYKLIFEMKTKVQMCDNITIDLYGLSLTPIGDVLGHGPDHDFLVDVAGLVTGISAEREYLRDGKVTKMVVLQLTDNSGKCECALFGEYVDQLRVMLAKNGGGLPVFAIQFAKIKIFRGNISIQNVLSATRIYLNPSIREVVVFKKGLCLDGVEHATSIPSIGATSKPSLEDDFLNNFPKTSIANLLETKEDGIYVVGAVVSGLVDAEDWWYAACSCHRSVTADSGAYYCKQCVRHVFKMVPRFRVKLRVDDGTGQAVFVLFDGDMNSLLGKNCHDLVDLSKGKSDGVYPPELDRLIGTKLLFKVEKTPRFGPILFDGSFRVKRTCNDLNIIDAFDLVSAGEDSDSVDGVSLGDDSIESTQNEDFVADYVVTPISGKDEDVGNPAVSPEVINLGDDSNKDIEVFAVGGKGLNSDKDLSAKRNLLAAFTECDEGGASSSKIAKQAGG